MKNIFLSLFVLLIPAILGAEDLTLYDGEAPRTDLNRANGGTYYDNWWGGKDANLMIDWDKNPRSGKFCGRWECRVDYSGGSLIGEPSWLGLNIEPATNLEFWLRGEKGGESIQLKFFDTKLGKPGKDDGYFQTIEIKNIPQGWTRYSFGIRGLTGNPPGKRPLNPMIFEGFTITGAKAGTVVYFDDVKFLMAPRKEKEYSAIKINRLGWRPDDAKYAIVNRDSAELRIVDAKTGTGVYSVKPVLEMELDPASGDRICRADFSEFRKPGTYFLELADKTRSARFSIRDDVYNESWIDMMRFFYYQRCGIAIDAEHGGKFTHGRCHTNDARAPFAGRFDGKKPDGAEDVRFGWHDAGDDNKYSTPIYTVIWYLATAYMENPAKFPDNQLDIPESGNGRSDLVDEILWEMKWYLSMQAAEGPESGLVYKKVSMAHHVGNNKTDYLQTKRFVYQPSTADTLAFCATTALVARMLEATQKDEDSLAIARSCRQASSKAWVAYLKFSGNGKKQYPGAMYKNNPPGWDGSTTMNRSGAGERKMALQAAIELYALTGEAGVHEFVRKNLDAVLKLFLSGDKTWGADEFTAYYSYSTLPPDRIDAASLDKMKQSVRDWKTRINEYVAKNGYRVPCGSDGHFCWGSNGHFSKFAAAFWMLYKWDGKQEDLAPVRRVFDYLMGLNAVDTYMFTGRGEGRLMFHGVWNSMEADGIPPGYLVGGVDIHDGTDWMSKYPQKRFRDSSANWAVNEPAIYYQAPAVMISSFFVP